MTSDDNKIHYFRRFHFRKSRENPLKINPRKFQNLGGPPKVRVPAVPQVPLLHLVYKNGNLPMKCLKYRLRYRKFRRVPKVPK